MITRQAPDDVFDPQVHLAYRPPTTSFTFEDLKLQPPPTSTKVAATLPFPILSPAGVRAYRRALFADDVLASCAHMFGAGTLTIRNAAAHSRFVKDFWTHPDTLALLSEAAGVPLAIVMETEIGHTNIQVSGASVAEMTAALRVEPEATKVPLTDADRNYDPLQASSVIPWHYDSYPYVCVIMLSDTDGMVGGETYIKTGDGVPKKVEGPALGWGCILQGGQVEHLAARAVGVKERITTITSFCADVPGSYDSSYICNVRSYSDRQVLFRQWTQYRLAKMKREIELLETQLSDASRPCDVQRIQRFARDQSDYLNRTSRQLVPFDEYERFLARFGAQALVKVRQLWERAEGLDDFATRVASVHQGNWMPDSGLWLDLAATKLAIQSGKTLEGQRGRGRWSKDRPCCMGDELLRQGLPETFIMWLDATGMYGRVAD